MFIHRLLFLGLLLGNPSFAVDRPLERLLGSHFKDIATLPKEGAGDPIIVDLDFLKDLKSEDIESADVTFFQVNSTKDSGGWRSEAQFPNLRIYIRLKCPGSKTPDQIGIAIDPSSVNFIPKGNDFRLVMARQVLKNIDQAGIKFRITDHWSDKKHNFLFSSDAEIPKENVQSILEPLLGQKSVIGIRGYSFDDPSVSVDFDLVLFGDAEAIEQVHARANSRALLLRLAQRLGTEENPNWKNADAFYTLDPADFDRTYDALKAKNASEDEIKESLFQKAVELSKAALKQ